MTPLLRAALPDESDFAFEAKRDAMAPHITAKWGWDEDFQRRHHAKRWAERTWSIISLGTTRIGTVALDWDSSHLWFGEFYIMVNYRRQGIGRSSWGAQSSYCVSTIRPENLSTIRPGCTCADA